MHDIPPVVEKGIEPPMSKTGGLQPLEHTACSTLPWWNPVLFTQTVFHRLLRQSGWLDLNQRGRLPVPTHLFPRQAHYQTMATPSYITNLPLLSRALAGA